MSALDAEEEEYSPKLLLLVLVAVALFVLVGIAAALAVPLQPPLQGGGGAVPQGTVIMPAGVAGNTKLNFSPAAITVVIGKNNTVTFDNRDTSHHTVTANDNSFNSGDIAPGQSWTYTFDTVGTFPYYCIYHHAWMQGVVKVVAA